MPTVLLPGPLNNVQARGKSRPKIKLSPEAYHSPEKEGTAQTWAWREVRGEAVGGGELKFQVGKQSGSTEYSREDGKHKGRETRTRMGGSQARGARPLHSRWQVPARAPGPWSPDP